MSNVPGHEYLRPIGETARELRELLDGRTIAAVTPTRLARKTREVMAELQEGKSFLRVEIGGRRMMVVDEAFVDRARALLGSVESRLPDLDPTLAELRSRFDVLSQRMNAPGARQAVSEALFADSSAETLAENYRSGQTETPG